jgi:uncharacterized membrane protein SirB2
MSLDYAFVKHVHVAAVAVTFALFALRGAWMVAAPQMLRRTWVRVLPHVVDTVLLAAALWLVVALPSGNATWIAAKVVGLVVYTGAGIVALRAGSSRGVRLAAFAFALATFAYIVAVAVTRSPWGPLARL